MPSVCEVGCIALFFWSLPPAHQCWCIRVGVAAVRIFQISNRTLLYLWLPSGGGASKKGIGSSHFAQWTTKYQLFGSTCFDGTAGSFVNLAGTICSIAVRGYGIPRDHAAIMPAKLNSRANRRGRSTFSPC
jgi:hypothetical protein